MWYIYTVQWFVVTWPLEQVSRSDRRQEGECTASAIRCRMKQGLFGRRHSAFSRPTVASRPSRPPNSYPDLEYFFACKKPIWFLNEVLGEVAGREWAALTKTAEQSRRWPKAVAWCGGSSNNIQTLIHRPPLSADRRSQFFDCSKKPSHIGLRKNRRQLSDRFSNCTLVLGDFFGAATARRARQCWRDVLSEVLVGTCADCVWTCTHGTGNLWASSVERPAPCLQQSRLKMATVIVCLLSTMPLNLR